jgi:hypothetical protein
VPDPTICDRIPAGDRERPDPDIEQEDREMSSRARAEQAVECAVGDIYAVKQSNVFGGFDLFPEQAAGSNLRVRVSVGWSNEIVIGIMRQSWRDDDLIARVTIQVRMEFNLAVKLIAQAIEAMLAEIPVKVRRGEVDA